MTASRKLLSILIPAYNEQEVLGALRTRLESTAAELPELDFEFVFIDDGSKDGTAETVRGFCDEDPRYVLVELSRNFGKEPALAAGFDAVRGDATVVIDADLQDPPELIPEMVRLWELGYDDVYARRTSRAGESWVKRATSRLYYRMLERVARVEIQKDVGDFRLLDRRCIDALREITESQRNTKGLFSWIGYRKVEIEYERDARAAGTTKWNYPRLLNLALEGLTSFTTAPLRIASLLGTVVSAAAFVYLAVIVGRTLFSDYHLAGYPSTMAVILFLGGTQLLALGVVGEYLARVFVEVKQRPVYLVRRVTGRSIEAAAMPHEHGRDQGADVVE
ncbi:glycosyltransferase family 2 protein [Demequina mangrovi]|uniref:Glycosyltransferase involved in cell wall bisynthesis n=1 Tax=Demequina mangrovi TaxID=1043493 RepID=A0A1H7A547_9MICO|nr:glycosyltransferase family 2 protein [Demequina mangrovi]SEJ59554.1 Glycosyltransferase involved in cell wall bisynthesis [Demequina mangrovi]